MSKQASGPKISIVTVSLNQGEYLEETLRSVREQTYPHIEHIVMDGGSTDRSLDLIRQHEKQCPFPLQWRSEPDRGQSHAYNKAFALCSGDWILYLNSSDHLAGPDAVEKALPLMAAKPGYDMYAFPYLVREGEGQPAPGTLNIPAPPGGMEPGLATVHRRSHSLPHEATFVARGLVENIGGYDEAYRRHMDVDFFCRALQDHRLWLFCSPAVTVFRVHPGAVGHPEADRDWSGARRSHLENFLARHRTGAPWWGGGQRRFLRRSLRFALRALLSPRAPLQSAAAPPPLEPPCQLRGSPSRSPSSRSR